MFTESREAPEASTTAWPDEMRETTRGTNGIQVKFENVEDQPGMGGLTQKNELRIRQLKSSFS